MKNKLKSLLSLILTILISLSCFTPAYAKDSRCNQFYNDILSYNKGSKSIQAWIDSTLCSDAGYGSEWYILSLSQSEKTGGSKYDYSKFEQSLIAYTKRVKNIDAVAKQRISLCLASIGSTDSFINDTMNSSIGKRGIMSYIFGLHLLNNGYKSTTNTKNGVTNTIIGLQNSSGAWGLYQGTDDNDVTAMAIQSLAPQYKNNSKVKSSIDKALNYLSNNQNANGTFSAINANNYVETSESTAQVILALASLGIDCNSDNRFIKNSHNLFDALELFKSGNGFCHIRNGGINSLANQQVFYTMVGYKRMSNLYILDKARPNEINANKSEETTNKNSSQAGNGSSNTSSSNNGNTNTNAQSNNANQSNSKNNKLNANTDIVSNNQNSELTNNENIDNVQSTSLDNKNDDSTSPNIEQISDNQKKTSYKLWVIPSIIVIAILICAILHFTKKGNKGNYTIVGIISLIGILVVLLTNFESVDTHKAIDKDKTNIIGTVSISISCDTIRDEDKCQEKDGRILGTTSVEISEGETAYDILNEVCIENDIAIETTGSKDSIYVEGINNIYELEYGDLSGWMYHINGTEPSVSCGSYKLKDGDKIEWLYTKDLGRDL